jgi:hypothetical protein
MSAKKAREKAELKRPKVDAPLHAVVELVSGETTWRPSRSTHRQEHPREMLTGVLLRRARSLDQG